MNSVCSFALVILLAFGTSGADAKRLGDGKSVGQQSSNVTQREGAKPTTPAAVAQAPATAVPPTAASPKRPWGAMLGGLAAGLGWLGWPTPWVWGKGLGSC